MADTPESQAMRERLVRFYSHYHTPGLRLVDQLLRVYAGREDALMMVLEDKYGPEPPLSPQVHAASDHVATCSVQDTHTPSHGDLVAQLAGSLKQKTLETAQLRARVENLQSEIAILRRRVSRESQKDTEVEALRRENVMLKEKLHTLKLEHEFTLEERRQMMFDMTTSEQRVSTLQQNVSQLLAQEEALLTDLATLRLRVERPETHDEFTALMQDCRRRLRSHFDTRIRQMEDEMTRYYDYAAKQVSDRDTLIAMLRRHELAPSSTDASMQHSDRM